MTNDIYSKQFETDASRMLWQIALENNKVVYENSVPVRSLTLVDQVRHDGLIELIESKSLIEYVTKFGELPRDDKE